MRFDVITLFPSLVEQVLSCGINERARRSGLVELVTWNPRDFTQDVHRTVDDRPYGGGPGMLMRYEPLADALQAVREAEETPARVIYLSPAGAPLKQPQVNEMARQERIILVAGRYEGIDERFIEQHVDEEVSIGDYVLSGGELPAMTLIDAVIRQLPGALGHEASAQQDSFMSGLLDCPHYTRPETVSERSVPEVLLSGHHGEIEKWRRQQALIKTWRVRPELLESVELSHSDQRLIEVLRENDLSDEPEGKQTVGIGKEDEHH
ncbi:MAG: tRNA (guanosine(37)-N1)-methyltransferase TrmD [Thiotrichales bacterium]